MLLEQRQVQLPLAREVLVEHRLADPGPVGDVVHGGGVEALRDEDVLRGAQQLQPAGAPGQAGRAAVRCGGGTWRLHGTGDVTGGFTRRMPDGPAITVESDVRVPLPDVRRPTSVRPRPLGHRRCPRTSLPPARGRGSSCRSAAGEVFVRQHAVDRAGRTAAGRTTRPASGRSTCTGWAGRRPTGPTSPALLAVRFDGWAVDLPGFGRSQPPPRGRYSIRGHVRAVVDVLEHVARAARRGAGRPVHLLGNSLGGLVSLLVAARRPDLVATLTLISPAMPVYRVPPAFSRALLLLLLPGVPSLAERRLAGITPGAERARR